ncbi:hypothetical protein MMC22_001954 [Lobaria immixta]|nr:hypothetical protein [Lobaria immixta]
MPILSWWAQIAQSKITYVKNTPAESMCWLWNVAVQPVLEELGLLWRDEPPSTLPCVWWVSGDLMALLPLHAAGEHRLGSTDNTMSHVVSSYAPTLKNLQFSRGKLWTPTNAENSRVLVVAMPETPGHWNLNVSDEIAAIQRHIGSSTSVEVLTAPTVAAVLQQVTACSLNHQLAQVAYLSACSTAEIGARSLIGESIHLASNFQHVGFRHVIGTMWGAYDEAAVAVAAKFYEHLLEQYTDTVSSVPRALHRAISDLKAQDGNSENILLWAPLIHVGPEKVDTG